jgi:hypothetical protein
MTDTAQTPAATAEKAKTVADDMDNRRIFPDIDSAVQYLTQSSERFTDFGAMTLAAPGMDEEGNFDSDIYTDEMDVMVSLLRNKSKIKAIVVAPIPKIHVLLGLPADDYAALENPTGKAWLEKILHKEMNHVAVRALREAEDVSTVIDQMPVSIDGYLEPGRGDSGAMESFNELYKQLLAALGSKVPAFAKARLIKSEFKKALENRGYAEAFYPVLEDFKGTSLFEAALKLGLEAAKRKGLDPTIFQRWLDTRATKTYTAGNESDDEEEFSLDLDAMSDSMLAEETKTDADAEVTTDDTGETVNGLDPAAAAADADADPTT